MNLFLKIAEILNDAKRGKMFILVDDEQRENEGDLIIPASKITAKGINFMAKYGRGLICLTLCQNTENEDDFQFLERRGVSRFEVLKILDEYVKDFEHYLGDVAIQFDAITRILDINARYFPAQLYQWSSWFGDLSSDYESASGNHWVSTMEEPLKHRVRDWYQLNHGKREKVNWAIEKISQYFQDYKARTEERQSKWLVGTSMDIVVYLDTLVEGFRDPRLGPFEYYNNPFDAIDA